ncbi:MAG TPA: hypothetical protein VNF71_00405 [Acidimicrobiales bacterium]|nr:hypothetical protein [Acidimicrobiales bacterium]
MENFHPVRRTVAAGTALGLVVAVSAVMGGPSAHATVSPQVSVSAVQSEPSPYVDGLDIVTATVTYNGGQPPSGTNVQFHPTNGLLPDDVYVGVAESAGGTGYWIAGEDGYVLNEGTAPAFNCTTGGAPVIGIAGTPDGGGYFLLGDDASVTACGDAVWSGDHSQSPLYQPVVGIAAASDSGYWLVASDGGIFNYGDAGYYGSMGGRSLNRPIVAMAATPNGAGYWLVASDGGIFNFGNASFWGSPAATGVDSPVLALAATPDGGGYRIMTANGTVYGFGDGGSSPDPLSSGDGNTIMTGIVNAGTNSNFWVSGLDGQVVPEGSLSNLGDAFTVPVSGATAVLYTSSLNSVQTTITASTLGATSNQLDTTWRIPPGYWMVASDGGIFNYGTAPILGSHGGSPLSKPIVGMAPTYDGGGYWMAGSDGAVFNYGDAGNYGSATGPLNAPVVGMAPTYDDGGYWLAASDGGVFTMGDAGFYGSHGGSPLNQPIVGMATTPDGGGYWLVASDGGIFNYGDARFYGSHGGSPLNQPIVAMAPAEDGGGYWLFASDGGVFNYGDAEFAGSHGGSPLNKPVVGGAAYPYPIYDVTAAASSRLHDLNRTAVDSYLFRLGLSLSDS